MYVIVRIYIYICTCINTSNLQSIPQQPNLHRAMRQVQKPVNNVDYMPLEVSCRVPSLVVLYVFESLRVTYLVSVMLCNQLRLRILKTIPNLEEQVYNIQYILVLGINRFYAGIKILFYKDSIKFHCRL